MPERVQVGLRLVLAQLLLVGYDYGVRDARDLTGDRLRAFADDDCAQAPAQLVRQTPPRARQPLRALIEAVRGEENDENVVHKKK